MTTFLLNESSLNGTIKTVPYYQKLSDLGSTFPIMLIGHADADRMYEPYYVESMQLAINYLGADERSPLLRSLLEAYNAGCKTIWVYPVAPMTEYVSDVSTRNDVKAELGGLTFYEKYHERLNDAYNVLKEYSQFHFVVPIEASFVEVNDIDFVTPLATLCSDIAEQTGVNVVGILGTRASVYDSSLITSAISEADSLSLGSNGRNIILVYGEALLSNKQMQGYYTSSLAVQTAVLCGVTPMTRSIGGLKFPGALNTIGPNLTDAQRSSLTRAKINPAVRTQRGKRGKSYEIRLETDNTLAPDGSQYWSLGQVKLVNYISNSLIETSKNFIGTTDYDGYRTSVENFMNYIKKANMVKDLSYRIYFLTRSADKVQIDIALIPYGSIRTIYFTIETGPGV